MRITYCVIYQYTVIMHHNILAILTLAVACIAAMDLTAAEEGIIIFNVMKKPQNETVIYYSINKVNVSFL